MKVVILGFGIAGVTVAQELRKLQADPDKLGIAIYGKEAHDFYARIRLPEVFGSSLTNEDLSIHPRSWYKDRNIETHMAMEAVSVDRANRLIHFKNGSSVVYDALVLAIGADALMPDLPGIGLAGLRAVREYEDADWVRKWISDGARSMAVLGGGLLGLEAARHLGQSSLEKVSVLEIATYLLPRQLDPGAAAILSSRMESMGMEIRCSATVEAFEGHGSLEGIRLKGGEFLPLDGALISMGVRPRVSLASEAGLAVKRGIVVDDGLKTDDPAIWALGDCAEFQGIVWGIIPAAMEQAPIVAARILGDEGTSYRQTIPRTTLKVVGIDLLSAGTIKPSPEEADAYRIVVREDPKIGRYEKFLFREGRLAGAIILGRREPQKWCLSMMGKEAREEDLPPFEG